LLSSEKAPKALRGPTPRGASRDGPPSPHRLEQPSPIHCRPLTSACRRRGHRHTGSSTGGRLVKDRHLSMMANHLDPRDLDRPLAAPCGIARVTIGTPSVMSRATGCPVADVERAFLIECTSDPAHRFHQRSRTLVRQHGWERATWPASRFVRRILRSSGRRDARCVGPTSAFSRSSYEHSCLAGSRLSRDACAPSATRGYRLLSRQSDSLRRATRDLRLGFLFPGQDG